MMTQWRLKNNFQLIFSPMWVRECTCVCRDDFPPRRTKLEPQRSLTAPLPYSRPISQEVLHYVDIANISAVPKNLHSVRSELHFKKLTTIQHMLCYVGTVFNFV